MEYEEGFLEDAHAMPPKELVASRRLFICWSLLNPNRLYGKGGGEVW